MPLYRTSGKLVHPIETGENVALAQAYLTSDDMTQYLLDPSWGEKSVIGAVEHIEWKLDGNGSDWSVTMFSLKELDDEQLRCVSQWVSGQNSDGLGEGFEQQGFAEVDAEPCDSCDNCDNGYECTESWGMCSFDWETNDCTFVRVK